MRSPLSGDSHRSEGMWHESLNAISLVLKNPILSSRVAHTCGSADLEIQMEFDLLSYLLNYYC